MDSILNLHSCTRSWRTVNPAIYWAAEGAQEVDFGDDLRSGEDSKGRLTVDTFGCIDDDVVGSAQRVGPQVRVDGAGPACGCM